MLHPAVAMTTSDVGGTAGAVSSKLSLLTKFVRLLINLILSRGDKFFLNCTSEISSDTAKFTCILLIVSL